MKQLLLILAVVVALAGCGTTPEETSGSTDPIVAPTTSWVSDPSDPQNVMVEKAIRTSLKKPTGELTKADLMKVTRFGGHGWQINAEGLREVAKLQNLTHLVLNSSPTTDEGLKEVAKLRKLKQLHLWTTKITDAGLKEVAKLKNLTTLNLSDTQTSDAGLREVAKLQNLTYLGLHRTKITDDGLKEVAKLKKLTELVLHNIKVTKAGMDELQKALPKCKISHNAKN